jgi:hypothetical protein
VGLGEKHHPKVGPSHWACTSTGNPNIFLRIKQYCLHTCNSFKIQYIGLKILKSADHIVNVVHCSTKLNGERKLVSLLRSR